MGFNDQYKLVVPFMFREELNALLIRHNMPQLLVTPEIVLTDFIVRSLEAFNVANRSRIDATYGGRQAIFMSGQDMPGASLHPDASVAGSIIPGFAVQSDENGGTHLVDTRTKITGEVVPQPIIAAQSSLEPEMRGQNNEGWSIETDYSTRIKNTGEASGIIILEGVPSRQTLNLNIERPQDMSDEDWNKKVEELKQSFLDAGNEPTQEPQENK